jgi:hypothetical protein
VKTDRDPDLFETENITVEVRLQMIRQNLRKVRNENIHQAYRDFLEVHKVLQRRIDSMTKEQNQPKRAAPPMLAEFLVSFLAPKASAQSFLGDLQEMYQKNIERFGEPQARWKYWIEVARSFGPLLWQWLKRVGFFTVLIDYFRTKFGL